MENGALTTSAPSGAKCLTNLSSKTLDEVKLLPLRDRRLWKRIFQIGEEWKCRRLAYVCRIKGVQMLVWQRLHMPITFGKLILNF